MRRILIFMYDELAGKYTKHDGFYHDADAVRPFKLGVGKYLILPTSSTTFTLYAKSTLCLSVGERSALK